MAGVLHLVAYGATGLAFCFVVLSLGKCIITASSMLLLLTRNREK
jgi:hypothetical protein